jgi:hypothetical protein
MGNSTPPAQLLQYCHGNRFAEGNRVSIYRKFDAMRRPSNDVYAGTRTAAMPPVRSVATPPVRPDAAPKGANHGFRRKASPANIPLPRTLKWAESLPPDVKPTALLRQYARIANVIAAAWDDHKAVSSYMDCLSRDDRGDRQGFPADVAYELQVLREYHTSLDAGHLLTSAASGKRG